MDDYALNPSRVPCARCGEVARGHATIGDERYCHPNDRNAPDCYSLQSREGLTINWTHTITPA